MKKEAAAADMGVKGSAAAVTQARVRAGELVSECVATFIMPAPQSYWWVPIAGPLLGDIAGGGLYRLAIRPFLPRTLEQAQ